MTTLTLTEIASRLGGLAVRGDLALQGVAALDTATPEQISFVASAKHGSRAKTSRAGALVLPSALAEQADRPCLITDNPLATFARITALFHPEAAVQPGIHPSAVIDATAQIGPGCEIGPFVHLGAGAVIGANSRLGAACVIGTGCEIGANALLHPRVTLYPQTRIGARCILHSGCVLGSDGFGNALENGRWTKIPQIGRVIVGDDCEIGANTCIDRGALADTVIGRGVKLDNLVHIAHNCQIGDDTAMAACVGIAGSTKIGQRCQIGGAAMIIGHLEIGDDILISAGTFIGKPLSKPGTYTSVMLQQAHADWVKNAAHLRHLHTMHERIKMLEKQISVLNTETGTSS
jgi:UDP-3-O-[3-hydroxymyristoyl] glucosamine N-acyltransferase